MTTPTIILNESGSVALDGQGNGTLQMRPQGPNEHWLPTVASVKCSSNVSEASCKIYIGWKVADDYFVDGTLSGSTGDSTSNVSGFDISARTDPAIWAVWQGGDAGAIATMSLSGTKEIR